MTQRQTASTVAFFRLMAGPSNAFEMENEASPDDRTSGIADVKPALRAPRPQSWAPPLPPHRVPIPPPPLGNQHPQARASLPVPSSFPRNEALLVAPPPS